jgi:hypothetical protein
MKRLLLAFAAGAAGGWIARELIRCEPEPLLPSASPDHGWVVISPDLGSEGDANQMARALQRDTGLRFVAACTVPDPDALPVVQAPAGAERWH